MPLTKTINFDNAANFTFNSSLAEVTASGGALTSIVAATETGYISGRTSLNVTRGSGAATPSAQGADAAASADGLDITGGGSTKWVRYNGASQFEVGQQATIEFMWEPQYTGAAPAQYVLLWISAASNTDNRVYCQHSSGTFTLGVSNGGSGGTDNFTLSVTAGQRYHVAITINADTGVAKLYLDGTERAEITGITGTRGTANDINIGNAHGLTLNNNCYISDFQVHDDVIFTAAFTPNTGEKTTYSTDAVKITANDATLMTALADTFSESSTLNGGQIKHTVLFDNKEWYLSGGSLTESNGTFAQSRSASNFNTALASGDLNIMPNGSVNTVTYLRSSDGYTRPIITALTLGYQAYIAPGAIQSCDVVGTVTDGINPVNKASVLVESVTPFFVGQRRITVNELIYTESDGSWSLTLPQTASAKAKLRVTYSYTDSRGFKQKHSHFIQVPNQSTAEVDDIVVD